MKLNMWSLLGKVWHQFYMLSKRALALSMSFLVVSLCFVCAVIAQEALEPNAKDLKFWNDYESGSTMQVNHDEWQGLLDRYLDDAHPSGINRFDYSAVSDVDQQVLKNYLDYLQLLEPRQLNMEEAKAYWLNLYNAVLVDDILDESAGGLIDSVREIRAGRFKPWPWTRDAVEVVFQKMSLNDIEHNIIRPVFSDPRVHYVLSKGSLGGGNLLKTAFTGENNEELLSTAEKDFLNHPRAVFVRGIGETRLNSIFEWYAVDFGATEEQIMAYISENVSEETKVSLLLTKSVSYDYDWALNAK
jgi:hypothetical protein